MNQEELINIKAIARLMPESQACNHIFLLLANIDAQAATIENLKAALGEAKLDRVNFASACQEQIEALKEKLVEEVAWSHFNEERLGARQDVSFSDVAEEYRRKARQQLKADLDLQKVGVEWE